MVSRLSKLPWIVSGAVFIFVSVSCSGEQTRCYWCGPLAEQVHRSQRAPSCSIFHLEQHETHCDPGYTHCAIVAVSPPYAESRLCVKFYQDECYSLYCNSTKTWRMICACRGDLCNGPRSVRETHAFALLPKFTKTKPHKRNVISHFIGLKTRTPKEDDNIIILSNENETISSIQSDQPNENSNLFTPTPTRVDDNIIIIHGTLKDAEKNIFVSPNKAENTDESKTQMQETMPAADDPGNAKKEEPIDNIDVGKPFNNPEGKLPNNAEMEKPHDNSEVHKQTNNSEDGNSPNNTEPNKNSDTLEVGKYVDNAKEDKILEKGEIDKNLDKTEEDKLVNNEMSKLKETIKESDSALTATASMKPTDELAVVHSSGKLPAAEALQQNVTPTKAMELTTVGTINISTESHITESPRPSNDTKKNNGVQNIAHLIMFVISFLVHYCI